VLDALARAVDVEIVGHCYDRRFAGEQIREPLHRRLTQPRERRIRVRARDALGGRNAVRVLVPPPRYGGIGSVAGGTANELPNSIAASRGRA
jgi:hypothetical protein